MPFFFFEMPLKINLGLPSKEGEGPATLPSGISHHIPWLCSALSLHKDRLPSSLAPLWLTWALPPGFWLLPATRELLPGAFMGPTTYSAGQGKRGLFFPKPPLITHAFQLNSCLARLPEHRGHSQEMKRGVWGFHKNTPSLPIFSGCPEHNWRGPVFRMLWPRLWSQDSWKEFPLGLLGCETTLRVDSPGQGELRTGPPS